MTVQLLLVVSAVGHAQTQTMSGYSLKSFADFEKKWRLVTVRYRKDTGEMRFTYANDLAWEALAKKSKDYPDGAVFGKIGVATKEDPAFVSSAVPSGARRYQLMVRDRKRHADTNGWGYALFDVDGKPDPKAQDVQAMACAACHRLVPDRGDVFSQVMTLSPFSSADSTLTGSSGSNEFSRLNFESRKISELPASLRKRLPASLREVRFVVGTLRKHLFRGTLDEIRPALIRESLKSGLAAVLLGEDQKMYSLVSPEPASKRCLGVSEIALKAVSSLDAGGDKVYELNLCEKK